MYQDVKQQKPFAHAAALRGFGLGALVTGLVGLVAFAVIREASVPSVPKVEANASFAGGLSHGHSATALSAEEEAYAAELWPIHSEVKLAAVRMIFAGLDYKTKDEDGKKLRAKILPLTRTFEDAGKRVRKIAPPALPLQRVLRRPPFFSCCFSFLPLLDVGNACYDFRIELPTPPDFPSLNSVCILPATKHRST